MFEKKERIGLMIYLHYNRDARKLSQYGDITYHSRKFRYVLLYVDQIDVERLQETLIKEKFVKSIIPSFVKEIDQNFVGTLLKKEESC